MKRKLLLPLVAFTLASSSGAVLHAQQGASPNADNTRVNKEDRDRGEPTADQGRNNRSDRDRMQKIRKSLMDDKSLSTYAHNVKVISQNGKVTLKGPVRSEEEKKSVERKAEDVAGSGNVTSEITIKAARVKNQ
jgi:hyperosmotically inducible periplasmic protein